jgi:hypothetical protein
MDKYKGITNDSIYVASCKPTSPPVWDLEYFDRLIFVAQGVPCTLLITDAAFCICGFRMILSVNGGYFLQQC